MAPPYRADQIGSLIRPQYLVDARNEIAKAEGINDFGALHKRQYGSDPDVAAAVQASKEAEDKAMKHMVDEQLKQGITPITSGEMERPSFTAGFFEKLGGMSVQMIDWERHRTGHPIAKPYKSLNIPGREVAIATGKIQWNGSTYMDDWIHLKDLVPKDRVSDIKWTMPPITWAYEQLKDGNAYSKDVYSSDEEYLEDMASAARQEIKALYDAGLRFIQIDDPMLTFLVDPDYVAAQKEEGLDFDAHLDTMVKAHNMVLRDLPSDLRVGFHLCRGNGPEELAKTMASGSYHNIAAKMFREMDHKLFYLEFDTDRAGDFTPLKHLPKGKAVVLGLITTKDSKMEDIDMLKKRVYEAADVLAEAHGKSREQALHDNLAVSPQCGFSSVGYLIGTGMDEEKQWQKLEIVKKLAEAVWGA